MIPRRVGFGWLTALLVLASGSGCYRYVPVETGDAALSAVRGLEQGQGVRVRLQSPRSVDLDEITVNRVVEIGGEWVTVASDGAMVVSAMTLVALDGREHPGLGKTVRIPRSAVADLERKAFALDRTLLLAVPIGVAAAVLPGALDGAGGPAGSGGGGPPISQ